MIRHLRYGHNRNRKFKTQIHSHPTLPLHHRNYRRHPPNKQIGPRKSFHPRQHVIPRQRMTKAPTDLVPILLATLLHRWRSSNAPLVTYASVLLQVPVEVGVDVDMVIMGRPRISKCPQWTLISKGPAQHSTNQLLRLERTPKALVRRRQARLTKQRRRHTTPAELLFRFLVAVHAKPASRTRRRWWKRWRRTRG